MNKHYYAIRNEINREFFWSRSGKEFTCDFLEVMLFDSQNSAMQYALNHEYEFVNCRVVDVYCDIMWSGKEIRK